MMRLTPIYSDEFNALLSRLDELIEEHTKLALDREREYLKHMSIPIGVDEENYRNRAVAINVMNDSMVLQIKKEKERLYQMAIPLRYEVTND